MNLSNLVLSEPAVQNNTDLNSEQFAAYNDLIAWLNDPISRIALVEGKPGTGKTFLLKYVISTYKKRAIFTAPTNKATKVLEATLTSKDYAPDTCTIYSLLGLQISKEGEVKEVKAQKEDINISRYSLVVLDEGFMVNANLKKYIDIALENNPKVKLLILGDSYQIPPVGENKSTIEQYFDKPEDKNLRIKLTKVMRHGGDILAVVDQIRTAIDKPFSYKLPFLADYWQTFEKDVYVVSQEDMVKDIMKHIEVAGNFDGCKAIGWRNVTIDYLNAQVRSKLYPESHKLHYWEIGDEVTLTAPAKDFVEDKILATTDETGIIESVDYVSHPSISGFDAAKLTVLLSNNNIVVLYAIAPYDKERWTKLLSKSFKEAQIRVMTWKNYWELHDQVHYVRHGYAITAHRSQGSTYNKVYVNLNDILRNQNRVESLQCLFVACSRAKDKLIIGR